MWMACDMTYNIYRYYFDGRTPELKVRGLSIEEAQEWCTRDDTHSDDWFDGFVAVF